MAKTQTKPTDDNTPTSEETVEDVFGTAIDDSFDFEQAKGEVFGGTYPRLELQPNQVSAPLKYRSGSEIPLDSEDNEGNAITKMETVHVCELPNGELVSLPIASILSKHLKEAELKKGDEFRFKRYANAVKKRGKHAGKEMQVYAVVVTKRAVAES